MHVMKVEDNLFGQNSSFNFTESSGFLPFDFRAITNDIVS